MYEGVLSRSASDSISVFHFWIAIAVKYEYLVFKIKGYIYLGFSGEIDPSVSRTTKLKVGWHPVEMLGAAKFRAVLGISITCHL